MDRDLPVSQAGQAVRKVLFEVERQKSLALFHGSSSKRGPRLHFCRRS